MTAIEKTVLALLVVIVVIVFVVVFQLHLSNKLIPVTAPAKETPIKCEMVADVVGGLVLYECPLDNGVVCYVRNGSGGGVWCDRQEDK